MKILAVTGTYIPSVNGISISLAIQKKELEKRGHTMTVIAPDHPKKTYEKGVVRFPSVNLSRFPDYPVFIPVPKIRDLPRLADSYDLVYFHHPFFIGDLSLNLAKFYHCPSVFFYHTQYEQYAKAYTKGFLPAGLLSKMVSDSVRRTIGKSSHVIVETGTFKKKIDAMATGTPVTVITTARPQVKSKLSKLSLRRKYGLPINSVIALSVCRLSKEKNLHNLLKIFARIKADRPYILCLAGDGPEMMPLRSLAKELGISKHCVFLGQIDYEEINEVYALSDFFVFPSKTDTQAIVVLEALSAGLPVIGFDAPGPKDFVSSGKTGYIAENQKEFARYAKNLINKPELRKTLGISASVSSKKYSLEESINATEKLFYSLVKK